VMTPERHDVDLLVTERPMLDEWLEYHRATLLMKCDGLTDAQLRTRSVPPSPMSLLGLVRHMADVERHWFRNVLGKEDAPALFWSDEYPDGDFDLVDDASVADAFATFAEECGRSRVIAAALDLDVTGVTGVEHVRVVSHRWVLTHMIEEYARHNGHADLLRECIDGRVGD
jgi:uncharacterized damage-inducible protein DinB